MRKNHSRLLMILLLLCSILTACNNKSITQEEYDKVVFEKDDYKEKYNAAISERDSYKEQYESVMKELEEITSLASSEQTAGEVQNFCKYNKEELAELVDIVEYTWANGTMIILATNNSDVVIYVGANIVTSDSNGNVINNFSQKTPPIEPEKSNWFMYTKNNDNTESIDMDLEVIEVPDYDSITQYIDYNITEHENGISIECTNISDSILYNVNCSVLFLKGDNVVSISSADFKDYDFEFKQETTIIKTYNVPKNSSYDRYIYSFSGKKK